MWRLSFILVPVLALAAQTRVEVRNSEIWIIRDAREKQLTHDGRSKWQAGLSPAQNRIAYYEECTEAEHCTPRVVVLDLAGHLILAFEPNRQAVPPVEPCSAILSIAWVGGDVIAAECHINPSLSEYIETELSTGKTVRDLLGYDFTISPKGKEVAHVGWIVHFAPPYEQSNYLQIDHTTIYPLPKGASPVEQANFTEPPNVVHQDGLTYSGIHEFGPGMSWSPDSQHIALVDCTYDWTANNPGSQSEEAGGESKRHCSLAVVSRNGEAALFQLTDLPADEFWKMSVSWTSPRQVSVSVGSVTQDFAIP